MRNVWRLRLVYVNYLAANRWRNRKPKLKSNLRLNLLQRPHSRKLHLNNQLFNSSSNAYSKPINNRLKRNDNSDFLS